MSPVQSYVRHHPKTILDVRDKIQRAVHRRHSCGTASRQDSTGAERTE